MITFLQCFEAILVPLVLIESGLSSDDALSIYGILTGMALPVISFPSAINSSVSTMILPTIAGANTNGDKLQVRKTTEVSIWFSLVMGIFFIGFFLYFGDFIGGTIFGHAQAGEYIKILAWLCPFMYLSITMGSILHGLGRTNAAFIHNVIGTTIRLACLWFLVPQVGIVGYLWGLLGSDLVVTLLHGRYIKKDIHFSFDCVNNIILPVIWMLCSMSAGWLVKYILSFSSFHGRMFRFISSGISGVVLLGVFLYFLLRRLKELRLQ